MSHRERIETGIRALITGGVLRNHEIAGRLGMPVIDLQILNLLALAGGSMTPSELAGALHTPRSSITRIVGRLIDGGYVGRRESGTDGRKVIVEIDQKRLDTVTSEYALQSARLSDALAGLTAADEEIVARFLDALTRTSGHADSPRGTDKPATHTG